MHASQSDLEDHHHPHPPPPPLRPHPPPENGFVTPEAPSPGLMLSRVDGCVLPFLGGFGRYQKQLVVLTWIPALFIGFSQFSDYFLLAQPNSTCLRTSNGTRAPEHESTTAMTSSMISSMISPMSSPMSSSMSSSAPFLPHALHTEVEMNKSQRSLEHCACENETLTHQLLSGLKQNVVTKWNLVCDSAWKVHIAKFSLLVGSIFGYLVLGVLADWFGRHAVLVVSVFFTLVFGLSVAFSINVTMFSTLRFFEGFWLAGITLSLYVLRIELCLPGWRFSMTMVANFVVLAGQLLMPGLAALCSDWTILQAVIICPLSLMLSYIWLFPESLRWLLATQQYSRSKWLIERIAKKNNTNVDTHELITELNRVLEKPPKKTCIVKMVGTRNLWKNIVVLCVNSLAGYGIHHCFARSMMDHDHQRITMFHNFYADYYTLAGIAVATGLALCPAVGIMGRRGGLLMFMIITALASLLQLGLLNLVGKYSVQLKIESETLKSDFHAAFSIIGMFSSQAVSNLSIFFCAEITPTVIRGGGLGLVLASAGFGMLTAPIMELHNQKGYFLHHVIFACCTLICIICILLLPESRHQPLPESLAEGEGYTRHPLLPPHKKPAEQLHLLPGPHGRAYANDEHTAERASDYSNVRGTPLREVAVSTVESTASSTIAPEDDPAEEPGDELNAVRLNVLRHIDNSKPAATDSLPDLIVNAPPPDAPESPPTLHSSPSPYTLDCETLPKMDDDVTRSPGGKSVDLPELVTPPITHVAPSTLSSFPPPSSSSPIDSNPLLSPFPPSDSSPLEPSSPSILDETVIRSLPLTVKDPVPPSKVDSTTSSPIDSAVDCTISTANGGASS
ncbi:solute carrier family 22 member 23-like [Silurus meridionalis]|uniref:Solute carrier family 22 member 23 n=1 Tax=Silurus meridionalis TaxID=175797 RepID=A0A8T0BL16_SILME|nr:solute carrier family 22 member 23-like [Silurus meridionalis]KAF7706893.1 hypothetical protein HF521_020147 [Silurus meridionalis]